MENVTKTYGRRLALKDITFGIDKGQCFAVLGRNGAGKSTFIRLLLGLIFPTSGNIRVFGEPPGRNNRRIGYVSENLTVYPHLTARDNLLVAALSADQSLTKKSADAVLERLALDTPRRKLVKDFSLGMKRRLQLGMATMVTPTDLVVLDEPTNGLDVNGMLWLREHITTLRQDGVSVIMASHSLLELQESITHYVIFDDHRVVRIESWDGAAGRSLEKEYLAAIGGERT